MLWACLVFPDLPFDALSPGHSGAGEGSEPASCLALSESSAPRPRSGARSSQAALPARHPSRRLATAHTGQPSRIACVNTNAHRAGVREGQSLTAARARCPHLIVHERDLAAERQALDTLAAWAYRFSARVTQLPPHSLMLEVGASLRLFGQWPALERRLRTELRALGHAHALALAPSALAAQVLAGWHDGLAVMQPAQLPRVLGEMPLSASGLDDGIIAALHGMGFRRLREVFALPRAELARRIGPGALDHLDRLRGFVAEVPVPYRPPDRFDRRLDFEAGIDRQESLRFPLQRLVRELAAFLAARDGGVQRFELWLDHEGRATTRIAVSLLAPQRESDALLEFAWVRLERVTLAGPATALGLVAEALPKLSPLHHDLFDSTCNENLDWPRLAERLRARLGDGVLNGLACVADHRPERAWCHGDGDGGVSVPCARPFWLLPRPLPLRPAPTRILAGPERIEGGWWDGDDLRRDYYVVATRLGQRAWAFCPAGVREGWMLHGWFA
jgi:protein ImuB